MLFYVVDNSVKEINRLRKEIKMLLSKGMSNIYLLLKKVTYSKLRFYKFKIVLCRSDFRELQLMQILLNFQTSYLRCGSKTVCGCSIIFVLKGIMAF